MKHVLRVGLAPILVASAVLAYGQMPSFSVQQAQVTGSSAQQSTTAQNGAPVAGRGRGRRSAPVPPEPPGYQHIKVTSTVDGTEQDSVLVIPTKGASSEPRPIVVFLHAWSVDDRQRQPGLEAEAEKRDWLLLIPNFRGHYDHPKACGSKYARQDILDAVEWVKKHYAVDEKRVYLLGYSGGGFMTMLMGSLYPQVWAAASSWSGISDLTAWYHQDEDPAVPFARRYTDNMKACFGGAPTESAQLAADYRDRSPISHLRPELGLPFDLNAGSHDEIVSNEQTLNAFRILAPGILSGKDATDLQDTATPIAGSIRTDPLTKRQIYLRNEAHNVSVTIFDGGHEMLPEAAFAWFDQFARP